MRHCVARERNNHAQQQQKQKQKQKINTHRPLPMRKYCSVHKEHYHANQRRAPVQVKIVNHFPEEACM